MSGRAYLLLGGALVAGYFIQYPSGLPNIQLFPKYLDSPLPPSQAWAGRPDPCWGKDRCVLVAVGNGCPACAYAHPYITALRDQWKTSRRIGMKIVILAWPIKQNMPDGEKRWIMNAAQEEAGAYGDNTYIDWNNTFCQEADLKGIPGFVVVNQRGKILARHAGSYSGPLETFKDQMLDDLDLKDYAAG